MDRPHTCCYICSSLVEFAPLGVLKRGLTMKTVLLAMILGVALLAPALARADGWGCKDGDYKPEGCKDKDKDKGWNGWKDEDKKDKDPTAVPEPGIAILVGSGLLALGGIAVLRRKQETN
jgi:hypothetical protein